MNRRTISLGLALLNSSRGSGLMFFIILMSRYLRFGATFCCVIASNKNSVTFSHLFSSKAYIVGQAHKVLTMELSKILSRLFSLSEVKFWSPTMIGLSPYSLSLGNINPLLRLPTPTSSIPLHPVRSRIQS